VSDCWTRQAARTGVLLGVLVLRAASLPLFGLATWSVIVGVLVYRRPGGAPAVGTPVVPQPAN
jgi:hypothetical protein